MQPNFVGHFIILQLDDNHTYLVEQNGRVNRESESRLEAYFTNTSSTGKALRTDLNRQPTGQGMMVGRKYRLTETTNLRNMLEDGTSNINGNQLLELIPGKKHLRQHTSGNSRG